ncbi:hypothetical protein GCK72_024584 [Caenorhabditis remanei]|uniref:Uncharacterized protein n=1 Tax=Caenorhabditis remanei TaxID=31234 RepID=A0A6A5FZP1_CAERE|nr:hypothetical protein GCK72_024584 [Caenorhabditis remanei]KAF1748117.1 hypothetical protein GCK72_024584 [Caenorhabditis remanei]
MPGSVSSVPESSQILTYVGSVGFLVFSLMLTSFGYINNAWIVLFRPNDNDEFQRGVRNLDCYKTYDPPKIGCLDWSYVQKMDKFPMAFNRIYDATYQIYVAHYLSIIIIASQVFWLVYTIGHCLSLKFCVKVEKYKLIMFHVMVISVGLWIILLFIIIYETFTDQVLPRQLRKPDYEYSIGSGFWTFFLGGLIPYVGAVFCLFREQMQQSQDRLVQLIRHRRIRVPTTETTQGAEVIIPMNARSR